MKLQISRNTRKYIILYVALLLVLYLVIEMVPKVTDIFETTQILEPGNLMLTCETTGYLIKTETIAISPETGTIKYLKKEGAPVRKNQRVVSIDGYPTDYDETSHRHENLMENLEGYDGVRQKMRTPASGIFSLEMDGSEKALNPAYMDSLTYEQVKDLPLKGKSLEEENVNTGDPIYKITNDNKWYVVCWLKKSDVKNYYEGQKVQLQLPDGKVNATIRSITKEEKRFKVIFYSDMYYKKLATTREVDMTIESSEQSGLLIDNDCIIEKNGKQGVYVRNKNGDYYFRQVNVIETDGKESVISESSYYDPEIEDIVYTVSVYDEVLKQPEKELKKDLKEEEIEKEKKKQ